MHKIYMMNLLVWCQLWTYKERAKPRRIRMFSNYSIDTWQQLRGLMENWNIWNYPSPNLQLSKPLMILSQSSWIDNLLIHLHLVWMVSTYLIEKRRQDQRNVFNMMLDRLCITIDCLQIYKCNNFKWMERNSS